MWLIREMFDTLYAILTDWVVWVVQGKITRWWSGLTLGIFRLAVIIFLINIGTSDTTHTLSRHHGTGQVRSHGGSGWARSNIKLFLFKNNFHSNLNTDMILLDSPPPSASYNVVSALLILYTGQSEDYWRKVCDYQSKVLTEWRFVFFSVQRISMYSTLKWHYNDFNCPKLYYLNCVPIGLSVFHPGWF